MKNSHKYYNLEGLRGLAALIVVFWHYSLAFSPSIDGYKGTHHTKFDYALAATPLHILFAGTSAVCLFFVLSGFVLSLKFFLTRSHDVLVKSAARRYIRLVVPAGGSVLITYLLLKLGFIFSHTTAQITGSTAWLSLFWNFPPSLHRAFSEAVYGIFFSNSYAYNANLWTMKWELFGSFLVFMFLALFGKANKRWVMYAALSIILAKSYLLAFILGVAIADIWVNAPKIKQFLSNRTAVFLPIGLLLLAWYVPPTFLGWYGYVKIWPLSQTELVIFAQIIGAVFVMLSVLGSKKISRFLESHPLQYLGKISFSLYVLHLLVLASAGCFVFNHLQQYVAYKLAVAITVVPLLAFTFFVSSVYTRYVDARSIVWSKEFSNWLLSANTTNKREPVAVRENEVLAKNPVVIAD